MNNSSNSQLGKVIEVPGLIKLLNVYERNGNRVVSARELHEYLEVGRDFSTWIKQRIEKYQFIENQDFEVLLPKTGEQNGSGGHNRIEYALSMDTVKEIAMVENNEKGREARKYFIAIEKNIVQNMSPLDILKQQVALMEQQQLEIEQVKYIQLEQSNRLSEIEAKIATKNTDYYTISGYARLSKYRVDKSLALKLEKQCSSICNNRKIAKGKEYDAKYGEVNTYPYEVLKEVFENYFND